jgi:hypothetical protein
VRLCDFLCKASPNEESRSNSPSRYNKESRSNSPLSKLTAPALDEKLPLSKSAIILEFFVKKNIIYLTYKNLIYYICIYKITVY